MEEALLDEIEEISEIDELKSHENILHHYGYTLKELKEKTAQLNIESARLEKIKESGFIYSAELINGAVLSANICINDHQFSLINSHIDLLEPLKEEGEITFKAKIEIDGSIKKIVKCFASINEIKFLQAEFSFVKLED